MTLPVLTTTFVIVGILVLVLGLLIVIYAKTLILIALLVLGVFYLKYRREQNAQRTP